MIGEFSSGLQSRSEGLGNTSKSGKKLPRVRHRLDLALNKGINCRLRSLRELSRVLHSATEPAFVLFAFFLSDMASHR